MKETVMDANQTVRAAFNVFHWMHTIDVYYRCIEAVDFVAKKCDKNSNNLKTRLNTQDCRNNPIQKSNRSTLLLLSSRKQQYPLIAGTSPYKNSARFNPPDTAKSTSKSVIGQRVCSAKMIRIKQLQNQLADAHFHLNELSNENKLLKAIQKRQDAALKRYEGTNAELPRIINTHHEDLRVLQTKHKKLRSQYKEKCEQLKEKENELHSLQTQNKKLLQLSKDRHLGEREKLQTQVFDLSHRISQQDETIQTLKRKLALETKYLKHQLHAELVKHKETQKTLQDTQEKLKKFEQLNKQREKQYYEASNLAYFNRERAAISSQSLTNLSETRSENVIKGVVSFRRRPSQAATGQSLPALNRPTSITRSQSQETPQKTNREVPSPICETFLNFEQIKNFSLQKPQTSPALQRASFSTSRGSVRDSPIKESEEAEASENSNGTEGKFKRTYELPKSLKKEFGYLSDEDKDTNDQESFEKAEASIDLTTRSRLLHARLVSSATEGLRTTKTQVSSRSRSLTKENMDNIVENDRETKYDRDSVITVISRDMLKDDLDIDNTNSNSDLESEIELPVEFHADEDENVIRKSDINIDEAELAKQSNTSSHLSSLFTKLYNPSNPSNESKKDKDDTEAIVSSKNEKSEFKSVNGLLIHPQSIKEDVDIDKLLAQKSIPKEIFSKTPWDNDRYTTSLSKEAKQSSVLDRFVSSSQKDETTDKAEKPSDDLSPELEEIKLPESNVKSNKSNNVFDYDSVKESDSKSETEQKTGSENSKTFDKAKLLAAIKAIDDNENIEFIDQKTRRNSASNRLQITENLYRGIPTHSKKKSDIMKELFSDTKLDNNKNSKD
ncbi:intracellular protein transport protein USO1 isoform X1 [Nasonia vitripennis]|uniref:Lebercilin domain-containing protein n=2 Tax=Nasonia vitripennis TaxID=7425 RepID=A0A7M7H7R8_NASVI|nr:intracellular protein transport protein USO1 isoform X1 [Nasonia vitripennis]